MSILLVTVYVILALHETAILETLYCDRSWSYGQRTEVCVEGNEHDSSER